LIEVHHDPENALCDGAQSLLPEQFERLMHRLRLIARAVDREVSPGVEEMAVK
jgi:3-deoxy-7-phosphoheptulonate synthase